MIDINGKQLDIVTLDFETYYSSTYSLSNRSINTSEYIRHEDFLIHGCGIQINDGKYEWLRAERLQNRIQSIDWSSSALLAHNTAFDGFILSEHYGIIPGFYLDTLSMSRAIHGQHVGHSLNLLAKRHGLQGKVHQQSLLDTKGRRHLTPGEYRALGRYCADDIHDTYEVFKKLYAYIPDSELELIDLTLRMFCDPVLLLDAQRAENDLKREVSEKRETIARSKVNIDVLSSNPKFAMALSSLGVNPPKKISPKTGQETWAFAKSDEGFKALLTHEDPAVRNLAEARLKAKSTIRETRSKRFLRAGRGATPFPILLNYSGAHTHRWSGGNLMNLQNLPRGGELRRSLIAPPGHVIVVGDSKQVEARSLSWLAGQTDLLNAFARGDDTYKMMAVKIYNKVIEAISETERFVGKTCVLGLGYQMGADKLRASLAKDGIYLSQEECIRIVSIYRSSNYNIRKLWYRMQEIITCMVLGIEGVFGPISYGKGFIRLPNGLFLHYPGLSGEIDEDPITGEIRVHDTYYKTKTGTTKLYGGKLTENVNQALTRIIVADQMLELSKYEPIRFKVVTMSHDEIVSVVKEEVADEALRVKIEIMRKRPSWGLDIPLDAEGGYDVCYSK